MGHARDKAKEKQSDFCNIVSLLISCGLVNFFIAAMLILISQKASEVVTAAEALEDARAEGNQSLIGNATADLGKLQAQQGELFVPVVGGGFSLLLGHGIWDVSNKIKDKTAELVDANGGADEQTHLRQSLCQLHTQKAALVTLFATIVLGVSVSNIPSIPLWKIDELVSGFAGVFGEVGAALFGVVGLSMATVVGTSLAIESKLWASKSILDKLIFIATTVDGAAFTAVSVGMPLAAFTNSLDGHETALADSNLALFATLCGANAFTGLFRSVKRIKDKKYCGIIEKDDAGDNYTLLD